MAKTETVHIRVTGDIKEKAESDFVGLAASRSRHSDFVINSIQDELQIHKFLFSNLYDIVNSYDVYSESNLTEKEKIKLHVCMMNKPQVQQKYLYTFYQNIIV